GDAARRTVRHPSRAGRAAVGDVAGTAGVIAMHEIEFELEGDYVELNQLLKLCGVVDSGGAGKQLVASGGVQVDGAVELRKTCKIRAGQVVEAEGVRILVTDGDP